MRWDQNIVIGLSVVLSYLCSVLFALCCPRRAYMCCLVCVESKVLYYLLQEHMNHELPVREALMLFCLVIPK